MNLFQVLIVVAYLCAGVAVSALALRLIGWGDGTTVVVSGLAVGVVGLVATIMWLRRRYPDEANAHTTPKAEKP